MRVGKSNVTMISISLSAAALLAAVLCVFVLCRVDVYSVSEMSMSPALEPGDKVVALKVGRMRNMDLSDKVLVLYFPFGSFWNMIECVSDVKFIKRCIGIPGDTVCIHYDADRLKDADVPMTSRDVITNIGGYHGDDIFNMSPVYVPAAGDTVKTSEPSYALYKKIIEYEQRQGNISGSPGMHVFDRNYYFVTGDNHTASYDSRHWGFVPEEFLISYMLFKF